MIAMTTDTRPTRRKNSALAIFSLTERGGLSSRPFSLSSSISGMVRNTESNKLTHRI